MQRNSRLCETFKELAYTKCGLDAVEHLFNVAAGLDSQIFGDYEIVGQIKQAAKFAKEKGFIGTFMERLVNTVLQSSKAIKKSNPIKRRYCFSFICCCSVFAKHVVNAAEKENCFTWHWKNWSQHL